MKMSKMMAGVMAISAPAVFAANVAETTFNSGLTVDSGTISGSAPLGVAVCEGVRNAMQRGKYDASDICHPLNPNHAAFGDSRTCMPSLSSAELVALQNGTLANAVNLTTDKAEGGSFNLGAHLTAEGQTAANTSIVKTAASPGADDAVGGYAGGAGCVLPGGWTGSPAADVAAAAAALDSACAVTGKKGRMNVSVLPVSENADVSANYRFIKLDGVAPTLAEHLEGDYNLIFNAIGTVSATPTFNQPFGITGGAAWATPGLATAGDPPAKQNGGQGSNCFQPSTSGGASVL